MEIQVANLAFHYAQAAEPALRKISFSLESGSYWCVAGANGCGKSTLLKAVCGLLDGGERKGSILAGGKALHSFSRRELAAAFAYVPGGVSIQFPITVRELLQQGRFPFHDQDSRAAVDEVSSLLDLRRFEHRLVSELSWGEASLAILGRALVQRPQWLILDEALSALDIGVQRRIFTVLAHLNQEKKMGMLLVGHDLNLLTEFVPHALWLHAGEVLAMGPFEEILDDGLLRKVYGEGAGLSVGKNPKNGKPKIFFL